MAFPEFINNKTVSQDCIAKLLFEDGNKRLACILLRTDYGISYEIFCTHNTDMSFPAEPYVVFEDNLENGWHYFYSQEYESELYMMLQNVAEDFSNMSRRLILIKE